jgi:peptidoglycan/LPS O-acetylase OafA/YrhL
MSIQLQKVHRFEVLDALRGVAALLVVQIHMPFLFAATMPFPHAYLAVDFFFMLSGFVMAFAYGSRLRQGWPTLLFLRDRFIRLYPLFLLSIPFGLLHLFVVSHKEHSPLPNSEIPWLLLFTILLLPLPKFFQAGGVYSHPVVGPSWSLFLEVVANIGHALFLRSRTIPQLAGIVIAANLLLIPVSISHHGIEVGFLKGQIIVGIVRVAASYTYGVLLFELRNKGLFNRFGSALASVAILMAVLMSPLPASPLVNSIVDLLAVYLLFPATIILGSNAFASPRVVPTFSVLGTISYAIYILHPSVFTAFTGAWTLLLGGKAADHAPISGIVFVLILVLTCYAADRFYDLPIRSRLKARLRPRQTPVSTQNPEPSVHSR